MLPYLLLDILLDLRLVIGLHLALDAAEDFDTRERIPHLLQPCILRCQALLEVLDLLAVVLFALLQTLYQFALTAYFLLHLKLWSRDDAVKDLLMLLDWVRIRGDVVIV